MKLYLRDLWIFYGNRSYFVKRSTIICDHHYEQKKRNKPEVRNQKNIYLKLLNQILKELSRYSHKRNPLKFHYIVILKILGKIC